MKADQCSRLCIQSFYYVTCPLTPTDKPFGLGGKLFALLRPSLLLASQAADEAGRRLHLVSAALSVLQQRLMAVEGQTKRSVGRGLTLTASKGCQVVVGHRGADKVTCTQELPSQNLTVRSSRLHFHIALRYALRCI